MFNFWLSTAAAAVVLVFLSTNCADALQVDFYSHENYTGFLEGLQKRAGDDKDCYDLGEFLTIRSLRTDKCLMLYDSEDCTRMKGRSYEGGQSRGRLFYSYRVDKSTPKFEDHYYSWDDYRKVQSFHICSQERGGGPSLDVDYYDKQYYNDMGGKLVRQWRDVCTCQNVPKAIIGGRSHKISIDNHGNDMQLFEKENCGGFSVYLLAGDHTQTREVVSQMIQFDVRSFRPAGIMNCIKLDARIFKFNFKNGTFEAGTHTQKVKLAASGTIVNDGPAETSEEYMISEKVTESVEFSVAEGYTEMHTAGTEVGVTTTAEAGIPLIGKTEISVAVSAKYEYSREDTSSTTKTNTVSTETTVQITKKVTVPGCHTCTINGFVKQEKDFPIAYESYSKITGYAGGTKLRAQELKGYLPAGVDYVRDVDEFTVEAITYGTMYAEYGVNTLLVSKCDPIPGCSPSSKMNEPVKITYELPFETVEEGSLKSAFESNTEIGKPINSSSYGDNQLNVLSEWA